MRRSRRAAEARRRISQRPPSSDARHIRGRAFDGLLIAAGLLIKSFIRLQSVSPGFNVANVLTFDMLLPFGEKSKYAESSRQAAFFQQITERLEGLAE